MNERDGCALIKPISVEIVLKTRNLTWHVLQVKKECTTEMYWLVSFLGRVKFRIDVRSGKQSKRVNEYCVKESNLASSMRLMYRNVVWSMQACVTTCVCAVALSRTYPN